MESLVSYFMSYLLILHRAYSLKIFFSASDLCLMQNEIQKVLALTELLKELAFICAGKPFNIDNPKDVSRVIYISHIGSMYSYESRSYLLT